MRNDVQKIKWLLFNYTTRKVNASIVSLLGTLRTRTTSKFCCVFSHTPRIAVRKLCYSDRQPRDRFCPFCSSGLHVMTQFSARVYLQSYRPTAECWRTKAQWFVHCAVKRLKGPLKRRSVYTMTLCLAHIEAVCCILTSGSVQVDNGLLG